eukprot:CAMPEP_0205811930 /NCGR_PEP_ID=MMETSP0205-20121125/16224_1 /ASSEMBLY_ACC=CAM_ASM_000278 /TAXON_ID=36767 /ORGANISM="Euplotes focardii, Strain TN1" /LENGTH=91 /DNA_ID=CAMNT_0053091781 /DNA_START=249 /DNA_END=521 /DNA_ORIENTATION=+
MKKVKKTHKRKRSLKKVKGRKLPLKSLKKKSSNRSSKSSTRIRTKTSSDTVNSGMNGFALLMKANLCLKEKKNNSDPMAISTVAKEFLVTM